MPGSGAAVRGAVFASGEHAAADLGTQSTLSGSVEAMLGESIPAAASSPANHVPNQVVVRYRSSAMEFGTLGNDREPDGREIRRDGDSTTVLLELDGSEDLETALARLEGDGDVIAAFPNYLVYPAAGPGDSLRAQQWALQATGTPAAWAASGRASSSTVVAVIDSGFDLDHPDLRGRFLPGYDFCSDYTCTVGDADPSNGNDFNWHGTHVAGVIGAWTGNGVGISGVAATPNVALLPIKIFNDDGTGANTAVLIQAMRWAVGLEVEGVPLNRYPARVINLSLAGDFPSEVIQDVVDEVRAHGALVVAATGNAGLDRIMSPAAADGVLAVGATNSAHRRSCFSNYGVGTNGPGAVDIVAPGGEADGSLVSCGIAPAQVEGLVSTIPAGDYGTAVGTSMAAPMVSGVAGLILSNDPLLSVDELERRLRTAAYFDTGYMSEEMYGAGVLRADRALGLAGPGSTLTIELTSEETDEAYLATVFLDLTGSSSAYSFSHVPAGEYRLRAKEATSGQVYEELSLELADGEVKLANLFLGEVD